MRTVAALIGALLVLTACGINPAPTTGPSGGQPVTGQKPGWTQPYQTAFTTNCAYNTSGYGYPTNQVTSYCNCALAAVMQNWSPTNVPVNDSNSQQLQNIETQCTTSSGLTGSAGSISGSWDYSDSY